MRQGRLITTGLAVAAALALTPAVAAAAPSPLVDDDFAGGTHAGTAAASGSVQLAKVKKTEDFAGTMLPAGYAMTAWGAGGTATVANGALTVDGARVAAERSYGPGQVLEFTATFGAAGFQHVGWGNTVDGTADDSTFASGPWAMFSTGSSGSVIQARTLTAATGGVATNTDLTGVTPGTSHVFRIEWHADRVDFYVDGGATPVASHPVAITAQMRPAISDFSVGEPGVRVESLSLSLHADTGTFTSRVLDAGDARAVWGALTAVSAGGVQLQTRSGNTPTPDAGWSAFQPLGAGGAIQSPIGRYIQYQAVLTTADDRTTPTLDRVEIPYSIDSSAPDVSIGSVSVSGTTATVTFSSGAADLARFECSLDGGAFAACTSPAQFAGLAAGGHTVAVRGVDKAGNVGPAATQTFSVAGAGGTGGSGGTPDTTAPRIALAKRSVRASRAGKVRLKLTCPATETRCKVRLRLLRHLSIIARTRVTLDGGEQGTAKLQLSRRIRRQLAARGRMSVTLVVVARDAAGNRRQSQLTMTLRAPSR